MCNDFEHVYLQRGEMPVEYGLEVSWTMVSGGGLADWQLTEVQRAHLFLWLTGRV